MKKTLNSIPVFTGIVILLLSILSLQGQDFSPSQKKFIINGTSQLIDVDTMSQFKMKDKFIWSLHWGTSKYFMKKIILTN